MAAAGQHAHRDEHERRSKFHNTPSLLHARLFGAILQRGASHIPFLSTEPHRQLLDVHAEMETLRLVRTPFVFGTHSAGQSVLEAVRKHLGNSLAVEPLASIICVSPN